MRKYGKNIFELAGGLGGINPYVLHNCKYLQCIFGKTVRTYYCMMCTLCRFFCKTVCIVNTKRTDLPFSTPGVNITTYTFYKTEEKVV